MEAFGSRTPSEDDYSVSELLETILASPFQAKLETTAEFVCHTSSVPLATVVDSGFVNRRMQDFLTEPVHTPYAQGGCASPRCIARGKGGVRYSECIRPGCPCRTLAPEAQPICFLQLMTAVDAAVSQNNRGIDLGKTMFCTNHESIFSGSYSRPTREAVGLSSFENATTLEDLATILDLTYWSRTQKTGDRFYKFAKYQYPGVGVPTWKKRIKQVLFTIDSVIVQLMIICPYELSYGDLAHATRRMFIALLDEYSAPPLYVDGEPIMRPEGLFYSDLVNFTKFCKWSVQFDREMWLEFPAQTNTFKKTVGYFLQQFAATTRDAILKSQDDWTSLKQTLKKLVMSQKRGYGHLPQQIAIVKRHAFKKAISRPPVKWDRAKQAEVMKALLLEFTHELQGCHRIFGKSTEAQKRDQLREAMSHVTIELKNSASVDHKVSQGGKLEDARELITLAREGKWRIPVRDLHTGKRIPGVEILAPTDVDLEELPNFLFWTSIQIVVNWIFLMEIDKKNPGAWEYVPLNNSEGKPMLFNPFRARVLHVAEAAKERNLVKCSATYNWALIVGGKLIQNLMAESPSHKNGLQGSSADWAHFRRVQGSAEGGFLYHMTGSLKVDNTVNFYTDLTESTDWLVKELGLCILTTFQIHTGFYAWYMSLLKILYVEPIEILETKVIHHDGTEVTISESSYYMTEGTPMGMQLAKALLHGAHFCAMGLARMALQSKGKTLSISGPNVRK